MNFSTTAAIPNATARGLRFMQMIAAALLVGATGIAASFFAGFLTQNRNSDAPLSPIPQTAAAATLPGSCSLNLQFLTTSGNALQGGSMDYLLVARNLGTATCNEASISLYYAANEHFGSASPAPTADGYYWRLGNLAPGATANISVASTRSAPLLTGQTPNEACLSADNGRDACADAAIAAPTAPAKPIVPAKPTVPAKPATPAKPTVPAAPAPVTVITKAGSPAQPSQTLSGSSVTEYTPVSPAKDNGVWEWTSAYGMSQAAAQQIVNNAAASGFNVIYMTVDSSLNVSGAPLANYEASLNNLLTAAAAKNISVDAEAGASDWSQSANWSKPAAIITFVANYNQTHQVKFRGVQFDIEPYTTAQYTSDPAGTLTQYLQMVEALVNQDKNYGMPLGFDIPFFYTESANAPQVTVDGIRTYPYNQLVRLLNELPNGRIILMSYRNSADGSNGTIDIASPEIQLANGTNVKVVVGQETGNVQPSYVTFYGMTKAQMAAQVAIINQAFSSDNSFGGIAVDYLETYMQLR